MHLVRHGTDSPWRACGAGRHLACRCETPLGQRTLQQLGREKPSCLGFFPFIRRFLFVEDGPGGIYLSGQSSNPANRRHLRIDPSIGVGRSFSKFRTCCIG
jgi:hypothetical protein